MNHENNVGQGGRKLSLVTFNLIRGGEIVVNAWDFKGAQRFGRQGTELAFYGYEQPIYVSDDITTILESMQTATGLSFDNVLNMIRRNASQKREAA